MFRTVMDQPIGTFTELGRGSLVRIAAFRHDRDTHRDPAEEVLPATTFIVTTGGAWGLRGRGVDGEADPRTAVIGGRGATYRCRHPRRPTDRTLEVEIRAGTAGPADAVAGEVALIPRTPELEGRRARVVAAALAPRPADRLALDVAALELIGAAWAVAGRRSPDVARSDAPPDGVDRVELAMRWLDGHLGEDVGLADLAASAGISPFHFVRVFRARTGDTPIRHLRRRRLERAALLLRETRLPVTDVALESGFGSLSHFVTTFRHATGLPPGRWRHVRTRAG